MQARGVRPFSSHSNWLIPLSVEPHLLASLAPHSDLLFVQVVTVSHFLTTSYESRAIPTDYAFCSSFQVVLWHHAMWLSQWRSVTVLFRCPSLYRTTNNNSISLRSFERNVVVVVVVVVLNQFTLLSLTPFIAYMTTVLTRVNIGRTWKVIYAA